MFDVRTSACCYFYFIGLFALAGCAPGTAGEFAPTCSDGVKNGTETDADCGGSCGTCAAGKSCGANLDCASQLCSAGVWGAAACSDGVKTGTESDVDCGGGCSTCAPSKRCGAPSDCLTSICASGT